MPIEPNCDKRAHERIDLLEKSVAGLFAEHNMLKQAIAENTKITQEVANNTSELVDLVRGIKGLRSLIVWGGPIMAAVFALWAFAKGFR